MARLVYVIGASGAGKDSLIRAARARLDGAAPVVFAHRYITRPPELEGENHVYLSPAEFELRRRAGAFALHWDSHELRYGIGREIDQWLAAGLSVVVNGSRAYLDEARRRYPALLPVLVTVSPERLRERLLNRGRESPAEIEARLVRARSADPGEVPGLVRIANDGALAEAVERLVKLLVEESGTALA